MTETLANLQSYHAAEWFLVAAAILILIDYFFPTDWPAHVGYACVAASFFYFVWDTSEQAGPGAAVGNDDLTLQIDATGATVQRLAEAPDGWLLLPAFALAACVWLALAILHRLVFRHFLTNAHALPSAEGLEGLVNEVVTEGEG